VSDILDIPIPAFLCVNIHSAGCIYSIYDTTQQQKSIK